MVSKGNNEMRICHVFGAGVVVAPTVSQLQDVTAVIKHSAAALDINPFENSNNVAY